MISVSLPCSSAMLCSSLAGPICPCQMLNTCSSAVAIRNEIEAETMRYLQTKGKVVSADPIQLTVYSPVVPNLTLVDMPGTETQCVVIVLG